MCGRFNFLTHKKAVEERFGVKKFEFDVVPRYNIAPTQQIAVILQDPETYVDAVFSCLESEFLVMPKGEKYLLQRL